GDVSSCGNSSSYNRTRYASSTILRTRRHNFSIRQCHDAQKPSARTVSSAACLCRDGLSNRRLDIAAVDVANAKETRRGTFKGPGRDLVSAAFRIDNQFDVRISPIYFR